MSRKSHWDEVYRTRRPEEVSWFQRHAALSLEFIAAALEDRSAAILDVGGGASPLAGDLLRAGYRDITVVDLAEAALSRARRRLGTDGAAIRWVVGDALELPLRPDCIDFWHDRAVFHFLTEAEERVRYVDELRRVVRPGGLVLVATFAADGPERCSGLPVSRYAPPQLRAALGKDFRLLASRREEHRTPADVVQPFTWCLCRYDPDGDGRQAPADPELPVPA